MNIMKLFLYLLAISSLILIGANIPHESKTYFENGQLSAQTSHKRGERHGAHRMYFPDGALFLSANYSDGRLHGVKLTYSPNGQIVETETWFHGRLQSTSKPKKKKVRTFNVSLNPDDPRLDFSPYGDYKRETCGNAAWAMKDEARNGESWSTLDPLIQEQVILLEQIDAQIWNRLFHSAHHIKDTGLRIRFASKHESRSFNVLLTHAIDARIFLGSKTLPTFTESQIVEINALIPGLDLDVGEMREKGLIEA